MIKLSVVIPTRNRDPYLRLTLDALLPQVELLKDQVELVIGCNNCTDGTDEYITKEILPKYPYVLYKYFDTYVDVVENFFRSVEISHGEYAIIWGDDDIAFPFALQYILDVLGRYNNLGLFHFNRLVGKERPDMTMGSLRTEQVFYRQKEVLYPLKDFIRDYSISAGFISSVVIKREAWEKGKQYDTSTHYGYDFLARMYGGCVGMDCVYSDFPLVIQRLSFKREWLNLWPKYKLIGTPNIMRDLDKWGISENALETWHQVEDKSTVKYLYTIFIASAYKKMYKPLCKEINHYQTSFFRRLMTYAIIYLVPSFIYPWCRKLWYKS